MTPDQVRPTGGAAPDPLAVGTPVAGEVPHARDRAGERQGRGRGGSAAAVRAAWLPPALLGRPYWAGRVAAIVAGPASAGMADRMKSARSRFSFAWDALSM